MLPEIELEQEPGEDSEEEQVEIIDNLDWDSLYDGGLLQSLEWEARKEALEDARIALELGI